MGVQASRGGGRVSKVGGFGGTGGTTVQRRGACFQVGRSRGDEGEKKGRAEGGGEEEKEGVRQQVKNRTFTKGPGQNLHKLLICLRASSAGPNYTSSVLPWIPGKVPERVWDQGRMRHTAEVDDEPPAQPNT